MAEQMNDWWIDSEDDSKVVLSNGQEKMTFGRDYYNAYRDMFPTARGPAGSAPAPVAPVPVAAQPAAPAADTSLRQMAGLGDGPLVPEGMAPGQMTLQHNRSAGRGMPEENLKGMESGWNARIAATNELASAQKAASDDRAKALDFSHAQMLQDNAQTQTLLNERDARGKQWDDEIASRLTKVKDHKFQDFWEDKSVGDIVLTAIVAGVGGYAAALNGGPNVALEMIKGAIDADTDRQRMEYEKLRDDLADARQGKADDMGAINQKLGDLSLSRAQKWEAARLYLEKLEMDHQGAIDGASSKALMGLMIAEQNKDIGAARQAGQAVTDTSLSIQLKPAVTETAVENGSKKIATSVPKEFQNEAVKDYKAINKFNKGLESIDGVLNKARDTKWIESKFPGFLGGKSELAPAYQASIATDIVKSVPGLRSDNDFVRMIQPMIPMPDDPAHVAEEKKQMLFEAIMREKPDTSLLDDFDIPYYQPSFNRAAEANKAQGAAPSAVQFRK